MKIYSYILRIDDGAAPNPFGGICTLTICKPKIRKKASIGDWVIGTGSKNAKLIDGSIHDFSNHLVYAMKITEKKYLRPYDEWCKTNLPIKIPNFNSKDMKKQRGDCIYDFSNGVPPKIRESVHSEKNRIRDLSGKYSLLSNQFYYFGEKPIKIPNELKCIIKQNQGHLIKDEEKEPQIVNIFLEWIKQYPLNICNEPQLKEILTKDNCYRCINEEEYDDNE
jgi:hypothetical protein